MVVKHSPKGVRAILLEIDLICYTFLEAAHLETFYLRTRSNSVEQAILKYWIEVLGARYSSFYKATRRRIN